MTEDTPYRQAVGAGVTRNVESSEAVWKVPAYLTSLIGREKEVHDICVQMQQHDIRLLTLLGSGGVGKTRIALQVAHQLKGRFLHGIYFLSFSMIQEPGAVFSHIAHALEVRGRDEYSFFDQVRTFLEQKECLLILDNFEHVAAAAPELEQLLLGCPSLRLLVTSRSVLHLLGEHQYPIAPLPVPERGEQMNTEEIASYPSVLLFLRQAQAILPGFQMTEENARAIADICIRLDGLPLAIELAAARIKLIPLHTMLKELPQRLDFLSSRVSSYPVRQQTLLNTLNWSYDLLKEREQYLFRLLSVFTDGCTIDAVESVMQSTSSGAGSTLDILDMLAALMDNCLLYQVVDQDGYPRFYMLETMHVFGRSCLEKQGETEQAQQAHAEYYLALAKEGEGQLKGPQQIPWLRKLEQEHENFRGALQWLLAHNEGETLLQCCRALSRFWFLRGYWKESRAWMQSALDLSAGQAETALRMQVRQRLDELIFYQNNIDIARRSVDEWLALPSSHTLVAERIQALCCLCLLMQKQNEGEKTFQILDEAEKLCRAASMQWELAHVLRTRGYIAWARGDVPQAETCAQESLPIARRVGDQALIAKVLSLLAAVAMQQNAAKQAITFNQEILRIARLLEDKYLLATTLQNLGYLLAYEEEFAEALTLTQQGLKSFRELGYTLLTCTALHTLGYIAFQQGNYVLAFDSFHEGLALAHEINNNPMIGWHLIGLANLACVQSQYARSAQLLGAASLRLDADKHMNDAERLEYDNLLERVRQHSGKEQFQLMWQKGQKVAIERFLSPWDDEAPAPPASEDVPPLPLPERHTDELPYQLTKRELEVLQLVAQGLTNIQIAEKLVISARTVNWYLTNIYSKLQVSSRSAATRFAFEHHLLPTQGEASP
ncbi:serine/threonine protein kinase [Dictyobacter sp. S3.2.2.5]|uniref:Serine/threonine protein kinase n=1 Tax=Dictyobacter halimunensis TaxID=3026934 RepID=A0ABQ6G1C4_9CHLR|nr:serine/threonine protein kinase [Dictyobacter sp. S3.2.2.5]